MAKIRIPTSLRSFTRNQQEVTAEGATIGEVLQQLEKSCPGIGPRVLDDKGAVRRYVNVFLNEEDIRFMQGLETPVKGSDRITLITAVAGG